MSNETTEVIANCPNPECGEPIRVDHPYTWCSECGEPLPEEIKAQLPRARSIVVQESEVDESHARAIGPDALAQRYKQAYQSARIIVGAGSGVKVLGPIMATLFAIVSLKADGFLLFAGLASSLALGVSLYVAGVMILAQGELLRATTDSAINTSPLLDNDQKSRILADW